MKIICVIPVRYGSTRFPGKPLADLAGKPLIRHVVERAQKARRISGVVVATDDRRIAAVFKGNENGVCVEMTRADHASGTDRIAEVLGRRQADVVINLQGDEPLMDPGLIDRLAELFEKDPALEMATAKVRIRDEATLNDPNCVKVFTDKQGYATRFARILDASDQRPATSDKPYKHLGIYGYGREFLLRFSKWQVTDSERRERLEQLRALEHGVRIKVIEAEHDSIGVDTPEDLEKVRNLMAKSSRSTQQSSQL
ncbi:MAG: 3-deoxy-manno-octulosonate cytidylyltransferase [Candidatus Omnitrophica bacterium]|nr:3-deoxy-manno-octulosonate cytidylyltransferase [Candidatus Omnitrophota bacterium]